MKKLIKSLLINLIKVSSLILLVFHFILTFLYVMPTTPIKLKHQLALGITIGAFFPQNWSLFAPSPVENNQSLLVKCISKDNDISGIEQLGNEGWADITFPLWEGRQSNPFTAYSRIERTQTGSMRQYLGLMPELRHWKISCKNGNEESCKFIEEKLKNWREESEPSLKKIASSYCKEVNSDPIDKVAIRFRVDSKIPWSKRYDAEKEIDDYNIGIFPIDNDVILPGIYK